MTSMRSWAPPTANELDRLPALCARPEGRAYFFDRLENPNWVRDLACVLTLVADRETTWRVAGDVSRPPCDPSDKEK
jgi:hypothetical protein